MTRFLHGEELSKAVGEIAREEGAKLAVAFWGSGSLGLVSNSAKIICNLKMGGSNPHELQKIEKKLAPGNLRRCDTLHAKVYLGRTRAVITSANASANGLGLEDGEQAGWLEAGALVSDVAAIHEWFDALWKDADGIEADDWKDAKAAWKARQHGKPTLPSILDFDITQERLPMVIWYENTPWETNDDLFEEYSGPVAEALRDRFSCSIAIENTKEQVHLEDRWFLLWAAHRKDSHMPLKNLGLYWVHTSKQVLPKAFRWSGETEYRDVILTSEETPPEPFEVEKNPAFVEAFREVISSPEYECLRIDTPNDGDSWYEMAEATLPKLWKDLKGQYEKQDNGRASQRRR